MMKDAGMRAGVWDVLIALPSYKRKKCGLFIEFKSKTGSLSPEQKLFRKNNPWYEFAVFRDWQEAIELTKLWIAELVDEYKAIKKNSQYTNT